MAIMNCHKVQEELYEHFGQKKLPDYLEEHLIQCDDCRSLWHELGQLEPGLGNDESFYFAPDEIDEMTQHIENSIDDTTPRNVTLFHRIAQIALPVAASLLLLFGISKLANDPVTLNYNQDSTLYSITEFNNLTYSNDNNSELDVVTFNLLLQDYTSDVTTASGEALLDDITDDELEYLKDNLDMGDFL
ncbi:MAG: hypothetical protein U9N55_07205 [candidate division Zixibacteria bacterium]|nr:hypothetical protein [candidate division Zixibacteria bacterium]